MRYSLHPAAERELRRAAEFYREAAGTGLASALLDEFSRSVELLLEHPNLGSLWRGRTRRHVLRRFPFSLIYTVAQDELRILAAAHHSRRPGYWRNRR